MMINNIIIITREDSLTSVQFLDRLLVPVRKFVAQKLLDNGRFSNSGCPHHYHASSNFHYCAATGPAATVAAN